MKSRRGNALVLLLGVLALVFALGMGYFYFQNQQLVNQSKTSNISTPVDQTVKPVDETADWGTYTDETLGYSIKYPPNFTKDNGKTDITQQFAAIFNEGAEPYGNISITISVDDDPRNGESRGPNNLNGDKITKPEDSFALPEDQFERLKVQGFPAAKFSITSREGETTTSLRILKNGALWNITGWVQSPTPEKKYNS